MPYRYTIQTRGGAVVLEGLSATVALAVAAVDAVIALHPEYIASITRD